jgi:hypothetical protein
MTPKQLKILLGIAISIVVSTSGAITYFAPMSMAKANQEQIAMLDAKGQLDVWESRKYEIADDCIDKKTDEWICSMEQKAKYEHVLREIYLLEEKLGIEHLEPKPEGGP